MKVNEIIGNQCIWLFPQTPPRKQNNVKALQLVRALEARYGFYQGPHVLESFNLQKGISFTHGQFRNDWIIDKFEILQNAALVEAKVPTDNLEEFLDDCLVWARDFLGLPRETKHYSARYFLSQIEVETEFDLGKALSRLSELGKHIGERVRSYGQNAGDYGITNLTLHCDISKTKAPHPGAGFAIERRAGKPFESNLYFASAPMSTRDHLAALELLAKIL